MRAFRAAFTAAEGWGTFSQEEDQERARVRVAVKWGRLRVRSIALDVAGRVQSVEAGVANSRKSGSPDSAGRRAAGASHAEDGGRVVVTLEPDVVIETFETLDLVVHKA